MRHYVRILAVVCVSLLGQSGAWSEQPLSVDAIVERMQEGNAERQRELERYTGERSYSVQYHGTGGNHHGELAAHVEYTDHGVKHLTVVSETGSKLICERVLRKMIETEESASKGAERAESALSPANYSFALMGRETIDGMPAWVLSVEPKTSSKLLYRGRIWISQEDFAVMRVVGEPAKNPSWWINHASFEWDYGRWDGARTEAGRHAHLWLPVRSVAVSHVRIGGEARMTIEYGSYHVESAGNAAVPDGAMQVAERRDSSGQSSKEPR